MVETPERVAGGPESLIRGQPEENHVAPQTDKVEMPNNGTDVVPNVPDISAHAPFNAMGLIGLLRDDLQRGIEELRNEVARSNSPWMDAASAARYADCSPSSIFKAVNKGLINRYDTFCGPRFKREEIDRAMERELVGRAKASPK